MVDKVYPSCVQTARRWEALLLLLSFLPIAFHHHHGVVVVYTCVKRRCAAHIHTDYLMLLLCHVTVLDMMVTMQAWSTVRGKGKHIPSGGTLVIGREQDCPGGCFDSHPGAAGQTQRRYESQGQPPWLLAEVKPAGCQIKMATLDCS